MSERPHLTILLGAGSTIGAGLPSTEDITQYVLAPPDEDSDRMSLYANQLFQTIKNLLEQKGGWEVVNFEVLLHAMEQLAPFLGGPAIMPLQDLHRNVLKSFVGLPQEISHMLTEHGALGVFKGALILRILRLLSERIESSSVKEQYLSDLLLSLNERYVLKVFTLNYDHLIDMVELPWVDGFVPDASNFYSTFDSRRFREGARNDDPLLVHLHGSTLFGYSQEGVLEIHKYNKPSAHLAWDKGFTYRNVHGRPLSSGPIISGYSKVEQLFYRSEPYGYYLNGFINSLLNSPRIFILGYGGWDFHINEWLGQFLNFHKKEARIAYVSRSMTLEKTYSGSPNQALVNQINNHFRTSGEMGNIPIYGNEMILECAGFPFQDKNLLNKIASVLGSVR
jgi:hypothetical protein